MVLEFLALGLNHDISLLVEQRRDERSQKDYDSDTIVESRYTDSFIYTTDHTEVHCVLVRRAKLEKTVLITYVL